MKAPEAAREVVPRGPGATPAMAPRDEIRILTLGGGQDVGRSCIVVTLGERVVMLDCGMHMGYEDKRKFPELTVLGSGAFLSLVRGLSDV